MDSDFKHAPVSEDCACIHKLQSMTVFPLANRFQKRQEVDTPLHRDHHKLHEWEIVDFRIIVPTASKIMQVDWCALK